MPTIWMIRLTPYSRPGGTLCCGSNVTHETNLVWIMAILKYALLTVLFMICAPKICSLTNDLKPRQFYQVVTCNMIWVYPLEGLKKYKLSLRISSCLLKRLRDYTSKDPALLVEPSPLKLSFLTIHHQIVKLIDKRSSRVMPKQSQN